MHRRFPTGIPLLDPVKDMNIKDKDFIEMLQRSRAFEERLLAHPMHQDKKVETLCQMYHDKLNVGHFPPTIMFHRVSKLIVLVEFFFLTVGQ